MQAEPKNRLAGLDFLRFIAAFVVAGGHLLFLESPIRAWALEKPLLSPLKLGLLSVYIFFVLSGFVLAPQINLAQKQPIKWLRSRLVRLLPLYQFAWQLPLIAYVIHAILTRGFDLPISPMSTLLGFLASQSWSNKYYIDGPNPPLWSLSVEVWFSIMLLFFCYLKKKSLFIITITLFIILWRHPNVLNPITRSLPYFLLGIFLRNFFYESFTNSRKITKRLFGIFFCISLFPMCYGFLHFPYEMWVNVLIPIDISILILLFTTITAPVNSFQRIGVTLGSRTYSLYATHFPVLLIVSKVVKEHLVVNPYLYIITLTLIISFVTELAYRLVEKPTLELSRRLRK